MTEKRIDRYDEAYGGRDERYDVVCPVCKSAVGYPCTEKKLDGSQMVDWVHTERKQDVIAQAR